jgi:hypothetical protein
MAGPMVDRLSLGDFVVAVEGDDVEVFSSFDKANREIEREDALADYTEFYSGDGRELAAIADETTPGGWSLVNRGSDVTIDVRQLVLKYLEGLDMGRPIPAELGDEELLLRVARLQEKGRSWR